jgi:FkbM family methyltransferase
MLLRKFSRVAVAMVNRIFFALLKMAVRAPRGGFFAARMLATLVPSFKHYQVQTRYGLIFCDLSESVCYPLVKYGEYPHWRLEEAAFRALSLRPDSIVLDVGANIGVTVRIFAKNAGHVHAFEPAPRALRLLLANTRDLSNVTVHAAAVADRTGCTRFIEREALDSSGISTTAAGIEVPVLTVDSLGLNPQLIKIDVEGFEHLVLQGATQTLKNGPTIMFEALSEQARVICEDIIRSANPSYIFAPIGCGSNYLAMTRQK